LLRFNGKLASILHVDVACCCSILSRSILQLPVQQLPWDWIAHDRHVLAILQALGNCSARVDMITATADGRCRGGVSAEAAAARCGDIRGAAEAGSVQGEEGSFAAATTSKGAACSPIQVHRRLKQCHVTSSLSRVMYTPTSWMQCLVIHHISSAHHGAHQHLMTHHHAISTGNMQGLMMQHCVPPSQYNAQQQCTRHPHALPSTKLCALCTFSAGCSDLHHCKASVAAGYVPRCETASPGAACSIHRGSY
jgi:hypothetical protein